MYQIIAKRWFNRSQGNTYHSCYVCKTNQCIGAIDYAYGYGDGYLRSALIILQEAGERVKTNIMLKSGFRKDMSDFINDIKKNPKKYLVSVYDVKHKKDL